MSKAMPTWIKNAVKYIEEQEQTESIFFKLPEGETEILIDDAVPPTVIEKTFSDGTPRTRWQFKIQLEDGQQKTLEVGKQLYRKIIKALAQQLNPMVIIRAGTDIHTSYGIKGLMK